jgi:NDP-sugar pyrophosphorylase family protein
MSAGIGAAAGRAARATTAVLLAAGTGSRFSPTGETIPKCLAEVGGIPILARLMDNLRANNIKRLVIVTGYLEHCVTEFADANAGSLEVVFVENQDYANTNNIYSLWLAAKEIQEPFVLIESDLVFGRDLLASMLVPDKIAVSEILPWMNGTTVTVDQQHRVDSFHLLSETGDSGRYKTVNIYSLSVASWEKVLGRLEEHINGGRTGSYYEIVFSELVQERELSLEAVICPADRWYEMDTVADQQAAEQMVNYLSPAFL